MQAIIFIAGIPTLELIRFLKKKGFQRLVSYIYSKHWLEND